MTRFYRQNAAALALTLTAAAEGYAQTVELEPGLTVYCPDCRVYLTPDFQTINYFEIDSTRIVAEKILQHIGKNPDFSKKRLKQLQQTANPLETHGEELLESLKRFPKNVESTIETCQRFLKTNGAFWKASFFLDLLDPFENQVMEFIFGDKKKAISRQDLQVLMTPTQSVYRSEQMALQRIRNALKQKTFRLQTSHLLKEHARKYWWIQNNYQTVCRLQPTDFLKRVKNETYHDPLNQIEEQKPAVYKKYNLETEQINRLEQFLELAYLRDVRKKFNQIANYYLITFFHGIAKKNKVSPKLADFLVTPDEFKAFIRKDPALLEKLKKRVTGGVWFIVNSTSTTGQHASQTDGAKKRFEQIEHTFSGEQMLYGNTASLGMARGTAKIVLRQSDFGKFKEGDVLITGMTRPEFVPLMKLAAAIVTDEGGITSHAAIVSRELGKPCVIGTQTATKAFKDGDLLEVNANHGFVKKLEEKK